MELLQQLYKIHSPSKGEKKMRKFIKDWIRRNVPDAIVNVDKTGNVYVVRGESESYPCIVSHMDQVQTKHEKDFKCFIVDGKVFGFSPSAMEMRGLGADDKNGIWVCLKCLAKYDVMKCAFFVGEEIGCIGSDAADMEFFDDARYVLQCDRRNGGDFITSIWGSLCSKEFIEATGYKEFGYKETNGLSTDVGTLKDNGLKVSCVNMSCGYYKPHTDEEYTVVSELKNCLAFVEHIVESCTKVYPHEQEYIGSNIAWRDYYDYDGYAGYGSYGGYHNGFLETLEQEEDRIYGYMEDWVLYEPNVTEDMLVEEILSWGDTRLSEKKLREMAKQVIDYYNEEIAPLEGEDEEDDNVRWKFN